MRVLCIFECNCCFSCCKVQLYTLKEETFAEETFASGKIREIFGINFRELAVFAFLARINFREFMI